MVDLPAPERPTSATCSAALTRMCSRCIVGGKPSTYVRQLSQDAHYTEVTSTHNVVINEETLRLQTGLPLAERAKHFRR